MSEIKLTIHPFQMDTLKEAAKKVQEEAGEAFAEYVILQEQKDRSTTGLADEIADVIQASCNLAARYGINLQAAMERCERRNRGRGRYECDSGLTSTSHKTGEQWTTALLPKLAWLGEDWPDFISVAHSIDGEWRKYVPVRQNCDGGRCEERNRERGRYPMEEKHVEPCAACGSNDCDCGGSRGAVSVGADNLREKSPDEMSAGELIEALKATNSFDCRKILSDDWCDGYDTCINCRKYLFDMLKAAHEREIEKVRVDKTCNIARGEIAEMKRQIADLTHERDGLRRRLAELSEAGITELHRLLRETLGEAKNVTHNARVYINKKQESKDERCGDCGSIGRDHGGDCGAQCAREHLLPAEPTAQEMSEREVVIKRLREIDFTQKDVSLSNIGRAVLGYKPTPWWDNESRAALRDKLIELLSTPGWDYCKTCELVKSDDGE